MAQNYPITLVEKITPSIAQAFLETSIGNRAISQSVVSAYADEMKRGNWFLNGVPIVFNTDGQLLDGHHRLHAVVKSQTSVDFSVCRGVENGSFASFDCGKPRTPAQVLSLAGVKNACYVSSALEFYSSLITCGRYKKTQQTAHSPRLRAERLAFYKENQKQIDEIILFAMRCYNSSRIISLTWVAGLSLFLIREKGWQKDFVFNFFRELCSYDTSTNETINVHRTFILKRNTAGSRIPPQALYSVVARSWNAYASNKKQKVVRFSPNCGEAPELLANEL